MNIIRGDTAILNLSITTSGGVAYDITGYTITLTAIGPKTITKSTASGITITNGVGGLAAISLSSADTDTVGVYNYDVQINDTTHKYTVVISNFSIIDDITKI
jgi:hypothetical protein